MDESGPDESELNEGDRREQIRRLEHRIEELAEAIEHCRKFVLMSKIAVAAGGALTLAMAFGVMWFDPTAMIAGITAVIGGAVLLGSNSSTWDEKAKALQAAEAERAELISEIDLRLVGGGNGRSLPRLN
jgi:enoyl-CoA hydratase/carnithine racemase